MTRSIVGSSTVVALKGHVSADLEGESVILNLEKGVYYGLDPVGARVWELIQEPTTVGDVCDAILAEYEVEPARWERDLLGLLGELNKEGLIEVKNGPAT